VRDPGEGGDDVSLECLNATHATCSNAGGIACEGRYVADILEGAARDLTRIDPKAVSDPN
jgi:hypothetical protein